MLIIGLQAFSVKYKQDFKYYLDTFQAGLTVNKLGNVQSLQRI